MTCLRPAPCHVMIVTAHVASHGVRSGVYFPRRRRRVSRKPIGRRACARKEPTWPQAAGVASTVLQTASSARRTRMMTSAIPSSLPAFHCQLAATPSQRMRAWQSISGRWLPAAAPGVRDPLGRSSVSWECLHYARTAIWSTSGLLVQLKAGEMHCCHHMHNPVGERH